MRINPGGDQGWLNRERVLIFALGLSTFLAVYVSYLIVRPFIPAVAIAGAVAIATKGPHDKLRRKLKSRGAAAAISVVLVACLIFVPLGLLISYLVRQLIAGVQQLQADGGLSQWHSILPAAVIRPIDWAIENLNVAENLNRLGQTLVANVGGVLAGSVNVLTQVVIILFVLFFLYRDREQALNALRRMVPLSTEEANRMFTRIEDTILATVNGSLTVAFLQAMLAGVMYTVLGVPAAVVWAALTFVVALLPVFGTGLVWGPVALYLFLSGHWVKGVILLAWGALAVGTIDNLLYPYLVGGRLRLHTLPTFFSIVGGVGLFGPAGLILGPVALAITIGLLDVWLRRTAGGRTAEKAVEFPGPAPPVEPSPLEERG